MTTFDAWHFIQTDHTTGTGGLLVTPGQTLTVQPPLVLCQHGLHFSRRAIDAVGYAPGPVVCRVQIGGEVLDDNDKGCASERTCLWMADATETLRLFARQCALDVAHLWDMPAIVRQYLETGDETIRDAAWAAARDAAWAAAGAAARSAARSAAGAAARDAARVAAWDAARDAAWDAAWAAARDAARDAAWDAAWAAARDAARDAAWAAVRDAQNDRLETLLLALAPQEVTP